MLKMKMPVIEGTCIDSIKETGDINGLATYSKGTVKHSGFARLTQDWAECSAAGGRCGS